MIMVLVIIDDHIDNFDPAMQSSTWTNEEIILVKDLKNIIFKLLQEHVFLL